MQQLSHEHVFKAILRPPLGGGMLTAIKPVAFGQYEHLPLTPSLPFCCFDLHLLLGTLREPRYNISSSDALNTPSSSD